MKPIAEAARYQTPNTFSSSVYTANVSSVLDTPTMPNLTNCTSTGAFERAGAAPARLMCVPRWVASSSEGIPGQDER